jgi:hypothetical protein
MSTHLENAYLRERGSAMPEGSRCQVFKRGGGRKREREREVCLKKGNEKIKNVLVALLFSSMEAMPQ